MRQLLKLLSPYRGWLAIALLCSTLAAALESVGLSLFIPLMTRLADGVPPVRAGSSALFASYVRFFEGIFQSHGVKTVVIVLCVALVLKSVFGYLGRVLGVWIELRTVRSLRTRVFQTYLGMHYQFFLDRKHGPLVHALYTETAIVGEMVGFSITSLSNIIMVAALYGLLWLISWQATLVVSGIVVFLSLGLQALSGLSKRLGVARQRIVKEIVALGNELILGIRQVKMFAAERQFVARFQESACQLSHANLRVHAISLAVEPLVELVALLIMVNLIVLVSLGVIGTAIAPVPVLITFAIVLIRVLPVVGSLNKHLIRVKANMKSIDAVTELLAQEPQAGAPVNGQVFNQLRDAIRFDGVSFSYPGRSQAAALQRVTLVFPKGRTTALVGPSGSGKSTIIDLIIRLYEPSDGSIVVDGVKLQEYELASWRRAIGFVSQDTFIFNATIRDNIAFANPEASDADIRWATEQADAHEFIQQLPQGYETVVGERGFKLSGGERQRIAIARAIFHRPQVLIFDEATSALDSASEQRVQAAIARISRDRTVIVAAHRFSTISRADNIIVLDRGCITEQGTHQELLAQRGVYWNLYHADGLPRQQQVGEAVEADRVTNITR